MSVIIVPPRKLSGSIDGSSVVLSINDLSGDLSLEAGDGIQLTTSGNAIVISTESGTFVEKAGDTFFGNLNFTPQTGSYGLRLARFTATALTSLSGDDGGLVLDTTNQLLRVWYSGTWQDVAQIGALTQAQADARYLQLSGGMMTGALILGNSTLRLGLLSADPMSANQGDLYLNTTSGAVRLYTSGSWQNLAGGVASITAGNGLSGGVITSSGTIAVNQSYGFTWTGTHTFNNPGGNSGAPIVFGSSTAPTVLANGQFWYDGSALNFHSSGTTFNLLSTLTVGGTVGAGTAGSVLFISNTGTLSQDNTKFYWDDTNYYLGLGTNSGLSARITLGNSTSNTGGILFGDTYLYRSASGVLETSGNLIVDQSFSAASANFSVSSAAASSGGTVITYAGTSSGPTLTLKSRSADDGSSSVKIFEVTKSDNTILAQITADGTLKSKAKSFDIEHPLYADRRLVYGSLEGPEHGVYDRGEVAGIGNVIVKLPEYWSKLVGNNYTVHLSSSGNYNVYCSKKNENSFTVQRCGNIFSRMLPIEFVYFVVGTRQDISLIVEQ